jgi:hypothetical protein
VQRKPANFVILPPVARHLATTGEEDEVGSPIPLFDPIQPFVDFTA